MIDTSTTRIVLLSLGFGLAACAQETAVTPEIESVLETATAPASFSKVKLPPPMTTVKPGASVTFSNDDLKPLKVGETGTVILTVHEGYPHGWMTLNARSKSGVAVFGAGTTMRANMADITTHRWRIDFEAEQDGVHYIDVTATVEPEGGLPESRAYAVRVEVGDWQAEQAKVAAIRPMETLESGERAVIMAAEEVIDPR